jgi:hypothetical protein
VVMLTRAVVWGTLAVVMATVTLVIGTVAADMLTIFPSDCYLGHRASVAVETGAIKLHFKEMYQ